MVFEVIESNDIKTGRDGSDISIKEDTSVELSWLKQGWLVILLDSYVVVIINVASPLSLETP